MKKNYLKVVFFVMFLSVSLLIYSCGGGGSSSSVSGGGVATGTGAAAGNPAASKVTTSATGLDNATLVYSDGITETADPNCAYTYTSGGLLVCIPIDNASKETITSSDVSDNETVEDIADTVESTQSNKPYIIGTVEKPVKKPICDLDKSICALFDLKGQYPDMTVAVTPYKSLLAIPNQGKDALNDGYIPVAGYSADIAVFKTNGDRYGIDEIAKVLNDKGVTVKVYFVLPYKSSLASTFSSNNYKLYKVVITNGKPSVADTGKSLKVVAKGTDNVTFSAVLDGFYPFILAREINPALKQIDNGSVSGLTSAAITLLACDNESTTEDLKQCTAIGYTTLDSSGNYSLIYEKATEKKLFAEVVSSYLKDDKKVLAYDDLNGYNFGDIKAASYPTVDNLTDADKALLKDIVTEDETTIDVKIYFYPETYPFASDNTTVQSVFANAITAFMNNESYTATTGEYSSSYSCSYSISGDNTSITLTQTCKNKPVSESTDSNSTYDKVDTLTIKKENGKFNCSSTSNYSFSYSYSQEYDNKTYTSSESYKENESFNWVLSIDNTTRIVEKFTGTSSEDEVENSSSLGSGSDKTNTNFTFLKSGNLYYLIASETDSVSNKNYSYSYKTEWSNKYSYDNNNMTISKVTGTLKGKIYSIDFTCSLPHTLTSNAIINVSGTENGQYLLNGGVFDLYNAPSFYSLCDSKETSQQ